MCTFVHIFDPFWGPKRGVFGGPKKSTFEPKAALFPIKVPSGGHPKGLQKRKKTAQKRVANMEILFFRCHSMGAHGRLYKLYENVYYEKNKRLLFEILLSI